ncbi:ribbon-helix-helix / copG family protein [Synechococcus sp. RS9907]|uniref:ribbon-helix-helix protein, CopG family n=1 Tax=Synechococcus sp. RS9907 TaxID=221350 RepID=UPI00165E8696|nr:ribbon-helix-helix protein, CopG family [Synechococcus sp. RS9907]QNI82190.1 ribbon-helix-helix / copG family protein [Synechococcus sp. RS9907]
MSSSRAINIEGKREVRVSADVDRQLAQRVDAVAKASNSTRAEVVRAALRKL